MENQAINEVRAERFVLTDSQGRERAVLETDEKGDPELRLIDTAGETRVYVALIGEGATISLYSGADKSSLHLDSGLASPACTFYDHAGVQRLSLGADFMHICDESGQPVGIYEDLSEGASQGNLEGQPEPARSVTTWTETRNHNIQ